MLPKTLGRLTKMSDTKAKLESMRGAYQQLHSGADTLLQIGAIVWTERLLLRLVKALYSRRLQQIGGVLPENRDK